MDRRKTLFVIVLAVVGVAFYLVRRDREPAAPAAKPAPAAASAEPSLPTRIQPPHPHIVQAPGTRMIMPAERQALGAALASARAARAQTPGPAATAAPTTGSDDSTVTLADKTGDTSPWEKRTVATLNDVLGECYSLARSTQPDLAGSLTVQFSIAGEPKVGGLVDDVAFDEEHSTIASTDLRDCVRESISALELDPPPSGLKVGRQLSVRLP